MNRRRFMYVTGAGVVSLYPCSSIASRIGGELPQVQRESHAFGTTVTLAVQHASSEVANAALDDAFAELDLIEGLMSVYKRDSPLSQLNRHGVLSQPHPYLVQVLELATKLSRQTRGAFDVTVQPLWTLYSQARRTGALPTATAIRNVKAKIDWRRVNIAANQIRLEGPGTAITLNGIAQGFAADQALAALRRHGIEHALIDTGELGALGNKSDGDDWCVGIQHPRRADAYVSLARFSGRCLATSGDYEAKFTDDCRVHHIFDPRTGASPTEFSSVSILAPFAWQADALSTSVFVLGRNRGIELVHAFRDVDALLVGKDGSVYATPGFPAETS